MIRLMTCATVATMSLETAKAALNIPSDGSDGALIITASTNIDLSKAVPGNWDMNNSANAGQGIYDPNQWAVVFKYSSVVIQNGATVTFKNHASRAPVVWLVSGDVTNNGTISLDGQASLTAPGLAEPGPGGFRGSSGYYAFGAEEAAGFGPGGGGRSAASGGSYGSVGASGGRPINGNASLIPLGGGSGGGAGHGSITGGGGAGAGAMLIACSGNLSISGVIHANGGTGNDQRYLGAGYYSGFSGCGSGGGMRLIAKTFSGAGIVQALGGAGTSAGGLGRIHIERWTNSGSMQITPDPVIIALSSNATPQIWLPTDGPTVRIVSIGGNAAPADPRAEFGAIGADLLLPRVTNTTVVVETSNAVTNSVVTVRATPRSNGEFTEVTAIPTLVLAENHMVVRWTAILPVQDGYAAIQAKLVRP